jgi:hypothetical protein
MIFSSRPVLNLITLRDLVEWSKWGDLKLPTYQRIPNWTSSQKLDFLNNLKDSGIFGSIILGDSRAAGLGRSPGSPRYQVVDGARRIDAILDAFGDHTLTGERSSLQFDLLLNRFVGGRKMNGSITRFPSRKLLDADFVDSLEEELHISIAAGTIKKGGLAHARNLRKIEAFLDLRLPAYIVEDSGLSNYDCFINLNSKGRSLHTTCPNGYSDCPKRYKPAGKFNRAALVARDGIVGALPGVTPTIPFTDSTETTNYSSVFVGSDLDCRVTKVPGAVVNALALDLHQLKNYLSSVTNRAYEVLDLPPEIHYHRDFVRSAVEVLEESSGHLLQDDGFYDEKVLDNIRKILSELVPTLNRATASMAEPLPDLLQKKLDYAGVFMDRDMNVGQILCRAGIFIRDDLAERDRKRTVDHELAHAYLRANKKKLIDCPWIEEGLAEWCSGHLAGSFPPISRFAFYDFLGVLAPLPLSDVQSVAAHWMLGDVPVTWWCSFVKQKKLPPPSVKKAKN